MKKLLLTFFVAFALCGSLFAQYEPHWGTVNSHAFDDHGAFCAGIMIDGVIIETSTPDWDALEVAAFVDDQLRGSNMFLNDELVEVFGDPYPIIIGGSIFYINPGEVVTFQMYNHANGMEYTEYTLIYLDGTPADPILTGEEHWEGYDWWEDGLFLNFTSPTPQGITLDITPYGSENDHYYLIASPVGEVNPEDVENMLENEYDLYYFDLTQELEWINYKGDSDNDQGGFNLEVGKGYLYANSGDGDEVYTLTFPGTGYTNDQNRVFIELTYDENAEFKGFNLIGNPFNRPAVVSHPYYKMNEEGSALLPEENTEPLQPMEGAFVQAEAEGETAEITVVEEGKKGSSVALNLSSNGKVIDRAIVSFVKGRQLTKFQLRENSTKVYIEQDNKNFALVNADDEMGEMPVNFKAEKNGNYNLSFNSNNVEFCYLHLIDNLTGNDVNLLNNPSYSFDAKTTDYASRFKLVFATGNSINGNDFAFISNNSLKIFGIEGQATLKVMDVTGRTLSTESFNGSYDKQLNLSNGVYMLQLIQGNDIKTQKIVVK